ncbi:DUF1292 domain-containing protein [Mesobacillus zeae]|uniref:DUF1292 domain-containing protein n=1 Tax=Mesobacillus zeae TaxID=1917180 RepID=A0A398B6Z4_9BACI|nr:DUF1292 domain-containing protein [Mesobacillus zeae]RID85715.1 DUF1292 domain-containing protein [Mesobacillus zeae]
MDKLEAGEVFTITDEQDQDQEVEVLAVLTLDEVDYAAVSFVEDLQQATEEDIDVFFLKVDEENDFAAIESEEEFNKVSAAFEEMMAAEE